MGPAASPSRIWSSRNLPRAARVVMSEPRRVCRRLHFLRGWSNGTKKQIFTRGSGASRSDVFGAPAGVWLGVSGDPFDRGEDWLLA